MLEAGLHAPAFTLPDADMEPVSLSDWSGRTVVLFFFPRNGAPASALEAQEFSDLETEFAEAGCQVLGISPDDCLSQAEFRDEHGLSVTLLSDTDLDVASAYGAVQTRSAPGGDRQVVQRATFVIDGDGVVRHAIAGNTHRGHAQQVLSLVKSLDKLAVGALG